MLNGTEPKIVSGPEILNKFVGESEENVRKLFADAEAEYELSGDDSALHIIIFDEIDAICKQRGTSFAFPLNFFLNFLILFSSFFIIFSFCFAHSEWVGAL